MAITKISGSPGKSDHAVQPGGSAPVVHAIIPAGGTGTRPWPLGRRRRPRLLLDLTGVGRSLLQNTVKRLMPVTTTVVTITGVAHIAAVADQFPSISCDDLLAELSPRDSTAAIGLTTTVTAHHHGRGATVGSLVADHTMADRAVFIDAVHQTARLAEQSWMVTTGIEVTGPSTAFGYTYAGDPADVSGVPDGCRVLGFIERPNADTAAVYLIIGNCRWNAGILVARADVLLDHLAELRSQLTQGIETIAAVRDAPGCEEVLVERWPVLGKAAINHAIAKPVAATGGVATVPVSMGWNDVGGFNALTDLVPPRTQEPATSAGVLDDTDDTDGSIGTDTTDDAIPANPRVRIRVLDSGGALAASSSERMAVLLGVPGTVVANTPDTLLTTTPEHAQSAKDVVDALKAAGREDLLQRTTAPRAQQLSNSLGPLEPLRS